MPLPTSGTLTLNAIHEEAGGTSGTACTINDSDIRSLIPASGKTINTASGSAIEIGDFYGAAAETPIIIPTASSDRIITKYATENLAGFGGPDFYGYSPNGTGASLSNPNGGLAFGSNISFYSYDANLGETDGIGSYEGQGLTLAFRTNDGSRISTDISLMNWTRIDVNRTASADPSYGSYGPARSYYLSNASVGLSIYNPGAAGNSVAYVTWGGTYGQAMGKTGGGLYSNANVTPTHTLTFV